MKFQITRAWLESQLKRLEELGVEEIAEVGVSDTVMVCKLQLHSVGPKSPRGGADKDNTFSLPVSRVSFGAVWEGSAEKQASSENAIFGHYTPHAEFNATIMNQNVIDKLVSGKKYYVHFTEAPD